MIFALHIFMGMMAGIDPVVDGIPKAARRILPMTPDVRSLLKCRNKDQQSPADGWVFPARSTQGHLTGEGTKDLGKHPRSPRPSPLFGVYSESHYDMALYSHLLLENKKVHRKDCASSWIGAHI
jgi:hypothetical protein